MNILHSRRRIGLALMLTGALALPVATPAEAAPQARPGHYLDKGDNGKGKDKQARKNQGKAQQQARRAQNAQQQANRARQHERQVQKQARQQNQQAQRANQQARRAEARAAQERAQAQAARQHRLNARAAREQAQARAYRAQRQANRVQVSQQRHRHPHYVNARPRPQGRAAVFAVDGYLQDDGYQCVQLRDDQGNPYILEGRVEGLFAGDHVRLVAREAPYSSCGGYGRPVLVTRVTRVWADPHHRSAFFQANIDGSFEGYARWRRGDDWLRDARRYDSWNDGYEDDSYYDGY